MRQIRKSDLFRRQALEFAQHYAGRADFKTADRFLDQLEEAVRFIGLRPLACPVYREAVESKDLRGYEYRRWRLKAFPFSIFFRIEEDDAILLEALYPHKMDIAGRLPVEILKKETS